jgi:hypothetical protein
MALGGVVTSGWTATLRNSVLAVRRRTRGRAASWLTGADRCRLWPFRALAQPGAAASADVMSASAVRKRTRHVCTCQGLGAGDRDRTGMAKLEGPSGPSTFVPQRRSFQVSAVWPSAGIHGEPSLSSHLGHAKGTSGLDGCGLAARMSGSVGVSAVIDVEDNHAAVCVVDAVADSVVLCTRQCQTSSTPPAPNAGCSLPSPGHSG